MRYQTITMSGKEQVVDTTPDWLVDLFNQSVLKPALYFGVGVLVLAEDILPMQSIIRFMNREHIVETSDLMYS